MPIMDKPSIYIFGTACITFDTYFLFVPLLTCFSVISYIYRYVYIARAQLISGKNNTIMKVFMPPHGYTQNVGIVIMKVCSFTPWISS